MNENTILAFNELIKYGNEKLMECGWDGRQCHNHFPKNEEYSKFLTRCMNLIISELGENSPSYKNLERIVNDPKKSSNSYYFAEVLGITEATLDECMRIGINQTERENTSSEKENFNFESYKILFYFENYLREFLKSSLKSFYGDKWIEKGIGKEIVGKANSYKNKLSKYFTSIEYEYPLDYLDFPFYYKIIEANFSKIINQEDAKVAESFRKKLENYFEPIFEIRNAIGHCIKISKDEHNRFKNNTDAIMSFLKKLG